jgi:hypothetical protein
VLQINGYYKDAIQICKYKKMEYPHLEQFSIDLGGAYLINEEFG